MLSATGANLGLLGFSEASLNKHFGSRGKSDHSEQYPGMTREQYAKRALDLAQSSVAGEIRGYGAVNGRYKGSIVRYDTATNDWLRVTPNGRIVTMFKPDDGVEYFESIGRIERRGDLDGD